MRCRPALLALALMAAPLMGCTVLDVQHPTVTATPTATPQEDEPGWDCSLHGNGVCDILDAAAAWQAWDASQNALELGDQPTRIEYVGKSDVPVPGHMLVDGYLFRIVYPTI
jgi:hypothetical protein